jgi:hypothetical protein
MALPPVPAGAVHVSVTLELVAVAASPVGASATVRGVADAVAEAVLVPAAFTADTRKS